MVHTVPSSEKIDRRTFLFAGFAVAVGGATRVDGTQTGRLETLIQWLNASQRTRKLALQPCLDRIREMDPSIHAWVQVQPEQPIGHGKLDDIPFGAKDIMETRGLSTEYVTSFHLKAPRSKKHVPSLQSISGGRSTRALRRSIACSRQAAASSSASFIKEHMDRMGMPAEIFTSRTPEEVGASLRKAGFTNVRFERPAPATPWNVVVAIR